MKFLGKFKAATVASVTLLCVSQATLAQAPEQAGALLADGKYAQSAATAAGCAEPRCFLVLGRALMGLSRLPEAATALAAARTGPLAMYAARLQGEALVLGGRAQEALEPLRAAILADPDGPVGARAAALLADALLAAGDLPAARVQAERAAELPGQPPDLRAGMAWDAVQAQVHEPAAAARAARAFWLQHPEHPAAEAARALEQQLGPQPPLTGRERMLRASRLLAAGHPAVAVQEAAEAVTRLAGEERAEALLLRARAMGADGKRAEAGPFLAEAYKTGGARVSAQAGMLLARDRARRSLDAEALRIADEVARKHPDTAEAEESVLFCARLDADAGRRTRARARLAKLAAKRSGSNASAARWTLAWMSFQDKLRDAPERFAEFAASAATPEDRAQGLYWQARAGKPKAAPALLKSAAEADPLGWYGIWARQRLGLAEAPAEPPFPPPAQPAPEALPPRLALGAELASLGLLAEAAAEADFFVQHHPGDSGAPALSVYERARRYDRSVTLGDVLMGGRGPRAPRAVLAAAYPAAFPAEVSKSAALAGVDPYLLLSVMRRESLFKPDTRSAAGAVGLLQLLPATARRAAMVLGRPSLKDEQLVVPGTAIDLGAWYLSELIGRFGDPSVALAAYNAGPRVAVPWARKGAGKPLDEWVEDIPYRETRKYVKIVIGAWSAYRILAGGSVPHLSATVVPPRSGAEF